MSILDQTGGIDKIPLKNKKVLIIGSGIDLSGRKMASIIDKSNKYDVIIRLNKLYGSREDTGSRTDILFTRWSRWVDDRFELYKFFPQDLLPSVKQIIITNQHIGISHSEYQLSKQEIGVENISIGALAVCWCLHRAVREINLIGYGFNGYEFSNEKRYAENAVIFSKGFNDTTTHYNWNKERQFFLNQPTVKFI